jgi:hypothetical protein
METSFIVLKIEARDALVTDSNIDYLVKVCYNILLFYEGGVPYEKTKN